MSNGNGKNGKTNGSASSSAADDVTDMPVTVEAPPAVTPVIAPRTGPGPTLITTGLLALGGGAVYGLYRWRRRSLNAATPAPPLSSEPAAPAPAQGTPPPASPPAPAPAPSPAPAPTQGSTFWGTSTRGEPYRELLAKLEDITGMPLRLFLMVVANRESGWNRKARNRTAVETAASKRAVEAGPGRGNPPPKFAASLATAGSGGLFGALAPYVAWTGLDEGTTPYLDEDFTIIEDPVVAAICAAKYYQRIVANYPTVFATPGTPRPEDHYRVRLGWASPKVLREDPAGKLFQAVKGRMDEDLAQLGLRITDLPPPDAQRWPGLPAVVAALQGFPRTWK